MKTDIHPKYYTDVKVKCSCGATFTIGSTKEAYKIDICSHCHPFYTGKQKLVDTAGRVDKFMARQKIAAKKKAEIAERTAKKIAKRTETVEERITRKVKEKEAAKTAEKAKVVKKPLLRKAAKKTTKKTTKKK